MENERAPLLAPRIRSQDKPRVPHDGCFLVYIVFYLLGIGSLLPWNFFSNARVLFMFKLRNTTTNASEWRDNPKEYNDLQKMFESYLAVAAMVPNVLFMFLNTLVTKAVSLRTRIVLASVTMIAMFALTMILTKLDTDNWQMEFFAVIMAVVVVMNAGSAVLQGGIFGLSSIFPKQYTQSVMGGMGMGGVIAASANILCLWLGSDPVSSGFGYFLTAEICILAAMIGYLCLPCLEFARFHIETSTSRSINSDDTSESETSVLIRPDNSLCNTFKITSKFAYTVFIVFFVTLSCYPAVNSAIVSVHYESASPASWARTYFAPVTCFLFFNVGDLCGRSIAGLVQWPKEKSYLTPILGTIRVVFIPIFLFCNLQPRHHHVPVFFDNDIVPIIAMVIFALSNGYLGTLCMMYGPRLVDADNMETAGSLMSFFLSAGLGFGSLFSMALVNFV